MSALLRPRSLAGRRAEWIAAAACVLVLGALFAFDLLTPSTVTVTGLFTLPVGAAAWLLRGRIAVVVVGVAVVLLLVLGLDFRLPPVTATSRVLSVLLIGLFGFLAARTTVALEELRERRLRVLLDTAARLRDGGDALVVVTEAAARFVSHGDDADRRAVVWRVVEKGSVELVAESSARRAEDARGTAARVVLDAPLRRLLEGTEAQTFAVMELPAVMQDELHGAGVREVAIAPVWVRGRAWGLLSAGGLERRGFEAEELELLRGLADLLAVGTADRG